MDRKRLLLISFRIIIIGIIVAVGLQVTCKGKTEAPKSNFDAVVADLEKIASKAQTWCKETRALGGIAKFSEFTLEKIKFPASNKNGTYSMVGKGSTLSCVVQGVGKEDTDGDGKPVTINITIFPDSTSMEVVSK